LFCFVYSTSSHICTFITLFHVIWYSPQSIIKLVAVKGSASISQIKGYLGEDVSIPTINRDLVTLVTGNCLMKTGKGRATLYKISPIYKVFSPLNNTLGYFDQDPDTRNAQTHFNHEVISLLGSADLFNAAEKNILNL